ncbi:MAG: hypothetical protein ABJA80_04540 [bacterium]
MPACTDFAHLGQGLELASGDILDGALSGPVPVPTDGWGAAAGSAPAAPSDAPAEYAGTMRAADADIGFPQSMQKRDIGSFSRPQKAQETRGFTERRAMPLKREYTGRETGPSTNRAVFVADATIPH